MRARSLVPRSLSIHLSRDLAAGRLVLFAGAGFSSLAHDAGGQRRVPTGVALGDELWRLCFPDEQRDASTLQDLFHHALLTHRHRLAELIERRLRVSAERLPEFYQLWFDMPWRRIYTLNVDDLEQAAAARFSLRRRICSLSALRAGASDRQLQVSGSVLDVIHLNGSVEDGPERMTFSTLQYAQRFAERSPFYSQLIEDFAQFPMLFVGMRLDESPLWQALELGGLRRTVDAAPPGLLVTPQVTRARHSLLRSLNIDWLAMDLREFAEDVLAPLAPVIPAGLAALDTAHRKQAVEDADLSHVLDGDRS
jgi:hypothetical protein